MVELSCGQLDEGSKFERQVYLCSNGIGARKLDVNVRGKMRWRGGTWVNEVLSSFFPSHRLCITLHVRFVKTGSLSYAYAKR
jgi:hypothetical protein